MRTDKELLKLLVKKTENFRDDVSVFKIRNQNAAELHKESLRLALPFTSVDHSRELRYHSQQNGTHTALNLQDDAMLHYYHASGYKHFRKNTNPASNVVSDDATKVRIEEFEKNAGSLLEKSRFGVYAQNEDIRFEKLWQLKSAGMAPDGAKSPTVINRLVYAYRRFVDELPVWGSASVFIKTAGNYEVDAFGMDWRNIHDAPLTRARILSPEDAAVRALEELQNTNPEKVFTPNDFAVDSFALGYFSHVKTVYQTIMQPVYVAKFISRGFSKMGHVIVVPAAGTAYESISRLVTPPPFNLPRARSNYKKNGAYSSKLVEVERKIVELQ